MKAARSLIFLLPLLFLSAITFGGARWGKVSTPTEGTYEFQVQHVTTMLVRLTLKAAANGNFAVNGQIGDESRAGTYSVSGTLFKEGRMKLVVRNPKSGEDSGHIDGKWDSEQNTLVITKFLNRELESVGKHIAGPSMPQIGKTYGRSGGTQFILTKSANPDQLTVTGRTYAFYDNTFELRGTYFIKRNDFTAFGEVRGLEENAIIKIDGKFREGVFKLRAVITSRNRSKPLSDIEFDCPLEGLPELTPDRNKPKKDPKKDGPKPSRGSLGGSVTTDRASAKIGETIKLNLSYTLKGREDDTVQESVALYGPAGAVLARSDKERFIAAATPSKRTFDVKCDKGGIYTVRVRVKGELTDEWKDSASFTIQAPKPKTDTVKKEEGSWGLVEAKVGRVPPAEDHGNNTIAATIGEGSIMVAHTPNHAGYFTSFTINGTWATPPAELKPGQTIALTCSMTVSRSVKDPPILNPAAWFNFDGPFEMLERKAASVGDIEGKFVTSSSGSFKARIPATAAGGNLRIEQRYTGPGYGLDGVWTPCVYVYKWNAKPIRDDKGEGAKTDPVVKGTSLVLTSPDDRAQIRAKLDPAELTLVAGEPSKIVDITISGFRANTVDRVEVVFPQATDGWASLPGQIVAGGGNGSYDPANMGRPAHTDGYFFSARSTAPDSEQIIDIIVRQKDAGQVRLKLKIKVVGKTKADTGGAASGPWTGTWNGNPGEWTPVVLKQNGDNVTGTFQKGEGKLGGVIMGDKLRFVYDLGGKSGKGELTLMEDGSLKGHYTEDGDTTKWGLHFKRE